MKLFIGIVLLFFLSFAAADEFDEFGGVSILLGYFKIKLFYVNIFPRTTMSSTFQKMNSMTKMSKLNQSMILKK